MGEGRRDEKGRKEGRKEGGKGGKNVPDSWSSGGWARAGMAAMSGLQAETYS